MDASTSSARDGGSSPVVTLNVGGTLYCTTRDTLLRAEPCSMLARLLSGAFRDAHAPTLFLDRDGARFAHVLNYLRSGTVHLPPTREAYSALLEEADYFQLRGLIELLEEGLLHIQQQQQAQQRKTPNLELLAAGVAGKGGLAALAPGRGGGTMQLHGGQSQQAQQAQQPVIEAAAHLLCLLVEQHVEAQMLAAPSFTTDEDF